MTAAVTLAQQVASGVSLGFKNRIINGAMGIDQRNAGAATANTINGYTVDRWAILQTTTGKLIAQQNAGAVTPPTGFTNYLGVTSQSAYTPLSTDIYRCVQQIEGLNSSDFAWGTVNAQAVTLSFWVRSSLTGTFGGAIGNVTGASTYPFTYSIPVANTWTYITLTIPGPTSGTYVTNNTTNIYLQFALGLGSSTAGGTANTWGTSAVGGPTGCVNVVGTSGATWYITGVQLEVGTTATNFEYRDYGRELMMCQRYYEKSYGQSIVPGTSTTPGSLLAGSPTAGLAGTVGYILGTVKFAVVKRAAPTITLYDEAGTVGAVTAQNIGVSSTNGNQGYIGGVADSSCQVGRDGASGTRTSTQSVSFHFTAVAEL